MAIDIQKPTGALKRSSPDAGGANPRLVPSFGIVKDNVDPKRMGQLMVYLTDNSGTDPDNKDNWRPVQMLSPFFGFTRGDAPSDKLGSYKTNPSSYGMWMAPPDIGTTVLCLFVEGDLNYGFYIGSVPQPEALQMIPAIGATDNIIPNGGEAQSYGGALRLPVTNINLNNKDVADSSEYLTAPKPVHSYTSSIMFQQGILRDPIRGPIGSSSQRETPSRVGWGVITPGRPIYEGGYDDKTIAANLKADNSQKLRVVSRRGGHSIVMDDGDVIGRDNLVRIRTSLGHQILMSDDGQTLMILHSNGQSYIELGKEGTVDIYSTNSINLRTQGDLNLHADNNVNIHATKNLNLQGENIHLNTEKELKARVGTDYSLSALGKHLTKIAGPMSMESGGDISMASSSIAYVNGSKVNLNSGQTGTKPVEVPAIDKVLHTDTLFDSVKGFLAAPAKLVSITSRAPAHAPWSNAGQGVDVKVDLNASSQLPAAPANTVSATNNAVAPALDNPVTNSTAASAPETPAASEALNTNVTGALTGAAAQAAAAGPLAQAVSSGIAVANVAGNVTVGVGKLALTPAQLQTAGTIKPGAAALVTSLAAKTGNAVTSMTNNLFTGQSGAQNLSQLASNVKAQATAFSGTLQAAQTTLQNSGVLTGAETASQIGGAVLAGAQKGVAQTIGAIQQIGSGTAISDLTGQANAIVGDLASGNFASLVGEGVNGAFAGLQDSVSALTQQSPSLTGVIESTKGLAASAFQSIAASMKPMEAFVPQNLTEIAKEAAEESLAIATDTFDPESVVAGLAADLKSNIPTGGLPGVTDALSGVLPDAKSLAEGLEKASQNLTGALGNNAVSSAMNKLTGVAKVGDTTIAAFAAPGTGTLLKNGLSNAANAVTSGLVSSLTSTVASGLSNLPGGAGVAAAVTNLGNSLTPALPGAGTLKDAITGSFATALTGVNQLTANAEALLAGAQSQLGGMKELLASGLPPGAASQLQSALSSLASAGSGIKVPSIALNTNDRASVTESITTALGDPGIPSPTFGEIDEAAKGVVADFDTQKTDYIIAQGELIVQRIDDEKNIEIALDEWLTAQNTLPPGDPAIDEAKAAYDDAIATWESTIQELEDLDKEYPLIAAAIYGTPSEDDTA